MNENEINDIRQQKDFKKTTLSGYKRSDVKKIIIKSIDNRKIEDACYWSAELICAGHFIDLWDIILKYMSNVIHLGNPKLPIYIDMRFNNFKEILSNGYIDNELKMRNNEKIRQLFSEVICIICLSRKNNTFDIPKIKLDDYNIGLNRGKLQADKINYGEKIMSKEDPKELFIAINELCWNLKKNVYNATNAFYWIEWVINFENICNKTKKTKVKLVGHRRNMPVADGFQKHIIWMIWEILLYYGKQKSEGIFKIISSLLNLFCIKFKPSSIKKRRLLIYHSIFLITEPIKNEIPIYDKKNANIIQNVKNKINIIYKQIKKNEQKPKTDYLFNNSMNKNLEKTIAKLDKMDKLSNFMIRN
tara:strand:- start:1334 stop:2413 length:1080 start_codon:yes stop_codon:yes gene_type:complete